MSGGDPQQRQGRSLGTSATLLPVSQRVHADTQSIGELLLRQADESSKNDNVLPTQNLAADDALALFPGYGPREIFLGQLGNLVSHVCLRGADGKAEFPFLLHCAHL